MSYILSIYIFEHFYNTAGSVNHIEKMGLEIFKAILDIRNRSIKELCSSIYKITSWSAGGGSRGQSLLLERSSFAAVLISPALCRVTFPLDKIFCTAIKSPTCPTLNTFRRYSFLGVIWKYHKVIFYWSKI